MNIPAERIDILANLIIRPEGSGYVAFIPQADTYLFANADGRDLLVALREAVGDADPEQRVASAIGVDPPTAIGRITRVLNCLRRDPDRDGDQAGVWLLDDRMDGMGDRCETFGMPF